MNVKHLGISFIVVICVISTGMLVVWLMSRPTFYRTAIVTEGKAVEAVYATAVVEPVTWAAIAPIRTGRIVEINVDEGEVVNTGDVLARLDDADLRAQLKEEEALADFYKKNFERAEKLLDTSTIAEKEYELRKTDYARAEARIDMLEEQIKQLALLAPMDGTVLWRDVELGEVKEAGEVLFWVGQPRPLRLEAEVDEEDIPKLQGGQTVLITADAFPGEVLEGLVHWISPKGDPVNKSYRVYITLPGDTRLMIGMTVETNTLVQEKERALLVPIDALAEGDSLWSVEEGADGVLRAKNVPVKIGIRGEEKVEILNGVQKNDRILLPPFDDLSDGAVMRVK